MEMHYDEQSWSTFFFNAEHSSRRVPPTPSVPLVWHYSVVVTLALPERCVVLGLFFFLLLETAPPAERRLRQQREASSWEGVCRYFSSLGHAYGVCVYVCICVCVCVCVCAPSQPVALKSPGVTICLKPLHVMSPTHSPVIPPLFPLWGLDQAYMRSEVTGVRPSSG